MKSFDDFLATLSMKDQEETLNSALSSLIKSGREFSEQELSLAVLVAQSTATFNREILRRYHNWLTEQMQ